MLAHDNIAHRAAFLIMLNLRLTKQFELQVCSTHTLAIKFFYKLK